MEWKALRESLSYALDLNDYRDFLGVSTELVNDERLLGFMHEPRSDSKFVLDEAEGKAGYGWHSKSHLAEYIPSTKA